MRVSQLMSEGQEQVVISGRDDLDLHIVKSHQGHIVLMLEALCTPFEKQVFKMTYQLEHLEQADA